MRTLTKHCEPNTYEGRIYQKWLRDHCFHAETDPMKIPYTVTLPPPDPAVPIHLGQAFSLTVQDLLIRRQRMAGRSALWIPCMDSAAASAEAEIADALSNADSSKNMIGKAEFLCRTKAKAEHHTAAYLQQMMKLGCSCDWERMHDTTDDAVTEAAIEAFVNLYEDGFLYRDICIADWCPNCRAVLPETEICRTEQTGENWHLRYPFTDGSGYLFLTTARPETILADAAVAVNPKDLRYQNIIGKSVIVPLTNRKIPVLSDDSVSMDNGTGVRRVTPACDTKDYIIAKQRRLPVPELLTADAVVSDSIAAYSGMPWEQARESIMRDLKDGGFLVKSEPIQMMKAICRSCKTEVMPHLRKQWFLRTAAMAESAVEAIKEARIQFSPANASERCLAYFNNAPDQQISRPNWHGIPIPAFYCDSCDEMTVTAESHANCPKCGKSMRQDPDTLKTGFATALLPFAALGFPYRTDDLQYFFPTDAIITGDDLLTPFVSGMISGSMRHTDEIPFKQVILHGLLRDASGKKITAERHNGLDPMALISDYGADATRFALLSAASVGKDAVLSEQQVDTAQRLAEKLWNCARFVLDNLPASFQYTALPPVLHMEEQWILTRFNQLAGAVNADIDSGQFSRAARKLDAFIRHTFSRQYLPLASVRLRADYDGRADASQILVYVLRGVLRLMHPFMPFITEEIWQAMTNCESSIVCADYPVYEQELDFRQSADEFSYVLAALRAVRKCQTALHIPRNIRVKFYFDTLDVDLFSASSIFFEYLAGAKEIEFTSDCCFRNVADVITDRVHISIPIEQTLLQDWRHILLHTDAKQLSKQLEHTQNLLNQSDFCKKAPEAIVHAAKERRAVLREKLVRIANVLDHR